MHDNAKHARRLVWFPTSHLCALLLLATVVCVGPLKADEPQRGRELFEKHIRPVLVTHCYECHSATANELRGGLRLDTRDAMRAGGESGPAIVPGKPDESLLLAALRHESFEMPPDKRLSDETIAHFERWIELGAPDPRDEPANSEQAAAQAWEDLFRTRMAWWSLQPLADPAMPAPDDAGWSKQPIDRFIYAKLIQHNLAPAGRADRMTRIRRLSFALRGLPPAPDEVQAFLDDARPDAWPRLVDQLLASPHFGERWARHWMDVVRYTDTYGYEWDIPAKGAWRYRDYLIRALNSDVPINQLIREHIAGDLLAEPRINTELQINESLIGPMFYQMGENRHGDSAEFNGIHQEMLDNKIDAFSKAFQATTVACARCHDHKLDPITQREYYALGGIFMSARWITNTLDLPERHEAGLARLADLKERLRKRLAERWLMDLDRAVDAMRTASEQNFVSPDTLPDAQATAWHRAITSRLDREPPLEDLLYPWIQLVQAIRNAEPAAHRWEELAARYAAEQKARTAKNAEQFTLVADFRDAFPEGWSRDGVGLRDTVMRGDFTVALDGPSIVGRVLHGGLATHAASPRMNGALRTPLLEQFSKSFLSFEYTGGDFAALRTVLDNAFLTERQQYLNEPGVGWLTTSTMPAMRDRRVYIELATKTSNPNFPPRVGLGGACSEEQASDPRSWFGVSRVYASDVSAAPVDELSRFRALWAGEPPGDLRAAAERYVATFRAAVQRWAGCAATDDDVRVLNWLLQHELLTNHWELANDDGLGRLVEEYRDAERTLPEPATVNGMADIDPPYDYRLNVRGDYDDLGEAVPRGYLRMVCGSPSAFPRQKSGRRELAEYVADANNPLTARVFVNRVWQWLFGTGLVATPDDFGHLGERPSHPELLDYLARRFIAENWSLKQLIRSIVLTETWQQAGETTPGALSADPDNRLLHHYPLRRLEAEAIRDAMLAVSGRLDPQLYGPPLDPFRQNEDDQKRLFSGPLDGLGRRSIYTKITIMEPPKFLATFNQPEPKIPTGRRDVTTTPAQSLALLNDPLVSHLAEFWAQRMVAESGDSEAAESAGADSPGLAATRNARIRQRLARMFLTGLGRPATEEELHRWHAATLELAELHGAAPDAMLSHVHLWADVAHAFMNMKEFIYVR